MKCYASVKISRAFFDGTNIQQCLGVQGFVCGAIHSIEKANTGGTMATVHWSEKAVPKLGQSPVDHEGRQYVHVCFLQGHWVSVQSYILQPNIVYKLFRIQRQERLELRVDQWMKLRDKVLWKIPGDFPLKLSESLCVLSISRNFATDIYWTFMLFFRHRYDSQHLDKESWSWDSSTLEMHQSIGNQRTTQIYSLK